MKWVLRWVWNLVWSLRKRFWGRVERKVLSRHGFVLEIDDLVICRMTIQQALDRQISMGGPVKIGAVGGALQVTFSEIN